MAVDLKSILKEYSQKNKSEDFGFVSQSDEEIQTMVKDETKSVEELYKQKLKSVEELIMPLLVNLLETADNPMIRWPNRKQILEEKIKEILSITRGN